MNEAKPIIVIFDGECGFCRSTLAWVQQKVQLSTKPFQSTDLAPFGLTKQQCAEQVYVIFDGTTYSGAAAIGFLLHARGNVLTSRLIKFSSGIARVGYRTVASHRNSWAVKVIKLLLDRSNSRHRKI